ncbi:MAG: hypothetical protein ABI652_05020 [Acidobacteriota bacterium]
MRTLRLMTMTLAVLAFCAGAWAQAVVTLSDLDRLDASASEIRTQVTSLRTSDPTLASTVERSLGELSDEVTYLRVKLRREGSITRADYADVRDRLETLRVKASGEKADARAATAVGAANGDTRMVRVPVGAKFDVRLPTSLSSATARIEERFEATSISDYEVDGVVAIPAGSVVRGFVSSVRAAGKIDRRGSLTLSFDELRIEAVSQRLRASVSQAMNGQTSADVTRIGAGAAIGAVLGGIIGGGKGALLGVLVGGGGTMAATEGADVTLPAGTILTLRVDQPIDIAVPK